MSFDRHEFALECCELAYRAPHFDIADIEFVVVPMRGHIYIAFAGTQEPIDVVRDARIAPWHVDGLGWVPAGFVKAARKILARISALIIEHHWDVSKIIYTGHSLGGAVALLCAALMARYSNFVAEVITWGAPTVGSLGLLKDVLVTMYRNGRDIVPKLPGIPHPRENTRIGSIGRWYRGWFSDHRLNSYKESYRHYAEKPRDGQNTDTALSA